MDPSKPQRQQPETPDKDEEQREQQEPDEESQQAAAEPTYLQVASWGEGQFGPIVPVRAPPTSSETSSEVGASALLPGQQSHEVVQSCTKGQGVLQLSPKEWPMPGEYYPRNRHSKSQEVESPPQQQQLVTESSGTVQGDDNNSFVQCTQPAQQKDVTTNNSTQEFINDGEEQKVTHDVKLSMKNESMADEENTPSVAFCPQSNLCAEAINSLQPSSSDQAEDKEVSRSSSPTLVADGSRSDSGSTTESATTVLEAECKPPQIDLSTGLSFIPTTSVLAPDHWGTHTYPNTMDLSADLPYQNFIGQLDNYSQMISLREEQFRSEFDPRIAKKGLYLRHDPRFTGNNNFSMHIMRPPYYTHAAQQAETNNYHVPLNGQWQAPQQWEQMMQLQPPIGGLSVLQQQNMMQGVFLHQVPGADRFAVQQQINPMAQQVHYPLTTQQQYFPIVPQAQMSQQGVLLHQVPINEQFSVPQEHIPVPRQSHVAMVPHGLPLPPLSYMMQFPPPRLHYEVENSMQAMVPQQLPSTQHEKTSSQLPWTHHQQQPVTQQQQHQQLSMVQSQQGSLQHKPPVSQSLPLPQHHLKLNNQHNNAEVPVPISNTAVAEHQNIMRAPVISPENEDIQSRAEEARSLERPACPRTPWVTEIEAAMIYEQATGRPAGPVLSTPPTMQVMPDFSRPPPPFEHLARAPSKPPQQHRANGNQGHEQYEIPPRMLNNHNGKCKNAPPIATGIPSRRGRGGFYTTDIGKPIRGHGSRLPGRNESLHRVPAPSHHFHMNGSMSHSHISRNDAAPTSEEQPKINTINSKMDCHNEQNDNITAHNMDQHNNVGRNNNRGNYFPFRRGHRTQRGSYHGRNTYHQQRVVKPTVMPENSDNEVSSTTSNDDLSERNENDHSLP